MKQSLADLLAKLAAEPGRESFQGLTIFPGGRCRAVYRWQPINFENLDQLESYAKQTSSDSRADTDTNAT